MKTTPSPFIDPLNINIEHLKYTERFTWDYPDDFHPSGIDNYKIAYCSVIDYLLSKKNSPNTLLAITSELEKLLHWALRVKGKSTINLSRYDILEYLDFYKNPYPAWISKSSHKRFLDKNGKRIPNPKWRPYSVNNNLQVTPRTLRKAYSYIKGYYRYLVQLDIIKSSPFEKLNDKDAVPVPVKQDSYGKKILESEDIELLMSVLDELIIEDEKFTREKFIFTAMFNMFLRISDLSEYRGMTPESCSFFYKKSSGWWFEAYGKGNKVRDIPVNNEVMKSLSAYRTYLGLPGLPMGEDHSPLILDRNKKKPVKSSRHLRTIISDMMIIVIEKAGNLKWDQIDIDRLKSFTSHWLRHSGISDSVKERPLNHVQKDAGHSTLATTSLYVDSDDKERHSSALK